MKHFTLNTRKILAKMKTEKYTYREIALVIEKSISSISEEIKRNSKAPWYYDPYYAHRLAETREFHKWRAWKLEISYGLKKYVIEKLIELWSPEEIAWVLRNKANGKTLICHETIYQFIYSEEWKQLKLWKYLRHKRKPNRVKWWSRKKRSIIPNRVSIHERPFHINEKQRFWDYEWDLMIFSNTKKVLAVHVERTTKKVFLMVNENKTADEMEYAIHELICSAWQVNVLSITYDNGSENVCHEKVRNDYCDSFDTYFCDSYCSWQKWLVENTNKLLRQYLPRNIDPELLTQDYVEKIARQLNNRPRKALNYDTPNNCFDSCSV